MNGAEHLTTTTLTSFEWALIVGIGALFTMATGFFVSRLIKSLDRLDEAVSDLRETLSKEYVTKEDFKTSMTELRRWLLAYVRSVRSNDAAACHHEDCPVRNESDRLTRMMDEEVPL